MDNYYLLNSKPTHRMTSDRFIPLRESSCFGFSTPPASPNTFETEKSAVDSILPNHSKQLRFSRLKENYSTFQEEPLPSEPLHKKLFKIHKAPVKVLEAPSLLDDFYLSLMSWSRNNMIGVGLEDSVYFFNFLSNSVAKHFSIPRTIESQSFSSEIDLNNYVCGLTFNETGDNLATGDAIGKIYQTDVETGKIMSSNAPHNSRVGSLHWQENLLVSGSRDKSVKLFDLRQNLLTPVFTFVGHYQEICGLKLSPDGSMIASGGNDNQLLLWDLRKMRLLGSLGEHEAAVKALTWCPTRRSVLISGAGTADRKLRIFDTAKCEQIAKIDSGSQVCNLTFDKDGEMLISTHGYSLNQMIIWQPSRDFTHLKKEEVIIAHKLRVLYLATSPCGKYVATGAGDETIRIWNIINRSLAAKNRRKESEISNSALRIR